MRTLVFADRREAGMLLAVRIADLVRAHPEMTDPLVLALPRGGVPVALEVARALPAPLDLLMVRKIGVPWQPELAAAAVVDGEHPQIVVNEDVVAAVGMTEADLDAGKARELAEIERRRGLYLAGRKPGPIEGRDVIVVDDGIATGATTRAALRGVKRRHPRSLTLAIPVAPPETLGLLRREVDHLVCLEAPDFFQAIGAYYDDFTQVSDGEVVAMLHEAERFAPANCPGPEPG
jgi:putative phosphoribosyl transferase